MSAVLPAEDSAGDPYMPGNIQGLLYSLLLICTCFVVSYCFEMICKASFSKVIARKIVHIGVSNWFFIYFYCFDNIIFPIGGLLGFALINFLLEMNQRKKGKDFGSWGTVEYPLVVIILILFVQLGFGTKEILGCALLGMGYGDGLAAVVGNLAGGRKMPFLKKKTIIGSVVCFIVVSFVVYLLTGSSLFICAFVGLVAMLTEAYTPFNLDNITLPLVIFVLAAVLC